MKNSIKSSILNNLHKAEKKLTNVEKLELMNEKLERLHSKYPWDNCFSNEFHEESIKVYNEVYKVSFQKGDIFKNSRTGWDDRKLVGFMISIRAVVAINDDWEKYHCNQLDHFNKNFYKKHNW